MTETGKSGVGGAGANLTPEQVADMAAGRTFLLPDGRYGTMNEWIRAQAQRGNVTLSSEQTRKLRGA